MVKSAANAALTGMRLTVSDGISWNMIANIGEVVGLASYVGRSERLTSSPPYSVIRGTLLGFTDQCHRRTRHSQNCTGTHRTTQHIQFQTRLSFLGRGSSLDICRFRK